MVLECDGTVPLRMDGSCFGGVKNLFSDTNLFRPMGEKHEYWVEGVAPWQRQHATGFALLCGGVSACFNLQQREGLRSFLSSHPTLWACHSNNALLWMLWCLCFAQRCRWRGCSTRSDCRKADTWRFNPPTICSLTASLLSRIKC